jgi:glycosyltransferase involved in cell wall biosynthesis
MRPFTETSGVKLSVIVPCYQHASELHGCLESLVQQTTNEPFEIIVVDSGNDPNVQAAASKYPGTLCISGEGRLFCGAAKDFGASHATGEYFAFTDSDCRPEKGWVEHALNLLESGIEFAGGPILDALPRNLVSISDNILQFSDFQAGRPAGPIKHIPGANIIVSKETYFSTVGFPSMNSGDDVTLTMSYNQLHRDPIYYSPDLRVRHIGRRSLRHYLLHQHSFGKVRGEMGLFLTKRQIKFGARYWMFPAVVLKRYFYIITRSLKYDLTRFLRDVLLSPLLLLGLMAYAVGFQTGCKLNLQSGSK